MAMKTTAGLSALCILPFVVSYLSASTEVCTNSLIPGAKGDQGEAGDEGAEGNLGKPGPPGLPGSTGDTGLKGDAGQTGKTGPTGDKGEKGDTGISGSVGLKGKPGTTCDCGRYRKVVGQLDITVGKLRDGVKFVKNVILGLRETEESYYLLVKEAKTFQEALMNCRLRGGILAMPKTSNTNHLMADYVGQSGLTRVYIGVKATKDTNGTRSYIYTDSSPLQDFSAWDNDEDVTSHDTNSSCVELLSSGTWTRTECDGAMFFICEFAKSRRREGTTPTSVS